METRVAILHHDYPPRVRERVEAKLQSLQKFFDRIITMRALLERQNEDHRVELVANVGHGPVLVVDSRDKAFGTALDAATDRMSRLLTRHKEKLNTERRRGARNAV